MADELMKRVEQFRALELPGQPPMMHMGTAYLVNDLCREIEHLREQLQKAQRRVEQLEQAE